VTGELNQFLNNQFISVFSPEVIKTLKIVSIDAVKAFDIIQHPFMIKAPTKVGAEESYRNRIKAICVKPTVNIILNGERLRSFHL
jgi:hypothetical protein